MNWSAPIVNSLWFASSLDAWRRFKRALNRPEETQLDLLRSLLASNRACEFGRRYEFSSISTYREFAKRVPLCDYETIAPLIDRLRAGESNLLTNDRVTHLVPTSGTTTARKLIPFTDGLQREFDQAIAPWIVDLVRLRPRILGGPAYWSISPSFQQSIESSQIPIGFDDDVSYLGGAKAWLVRKAIVTPEIRGKNISDFQRETIRTLAACGDLRLISVWHPSFLTLLLDLLPAGSNAKDIWPNLQAISCWGDAAAEASASELAERFPGVLVQKKGLLATEAFITIPFEGAHPLALRSHFFEFMDSAGEIHLAHELRLGEKYEVVVSTSGGLWRYRLRDVVQVTGYLGKTPSLRFLGRANTSDLCGEKLTEQFVGSCVLRVFGRPRFALLAPSSAVSARRAQYGVSMQNLVDHVLQPIVGNYFRNSAQDYTVLDFLHARSHRQTEAAEHIRAAIGAYDVQAIDTLIGDITPPAELMQTQTDRKIAEEQRKTYEVQEAAQVERQQLVRQTSLADIQRQVVDAEQGVHIAELSANANIKKATGDSEATRLRALGEAEAIRATGQAKSEAYRAGVESLGPQSYTLMQLMQIVGDRNVRIVPDVAVTGQNANAGLVDGMLGIMLRQQTAGHVTKQPTPGKA